MADRKISELTVIEASGVSSGDLFLIVDINETDVNQKSKSFTASGLASYVFSRLSEAGAGERFYVDETNSTQRGFFGTLGVDTISGNTLDGGSRINIAEGVSVYIANFQNQNLIVQSEDAPTDSGTIFWYRPPISGLLGRTYYRYINPTGIGPSAVEWVESAPFETATIEIGTQQVISGIFNPLRIPAATNSVSGYGGIQFTDEDGKFLNASGVYVFIPITTSGIVGGVPTISGVEEGLPLVKKGDTLAYVSLSGTVINADFSNQQLRVAQGTASAPSYTFTGDLNTGIYSPAADQVGITVSGTQKVLVTNTQITFSGDVNIGDGTFNSDSDITVNSVDIGLGGGNQVTNARFGVNALNANSTGQSNAAFGSESLINNQGGANNTAVGYQSLYSNVGGLRNTGLGTYALYSNINANGNTAIGYEALYDAVSADGNVAIGGYSLGNTTGSRNVGVGFEAGFVNTAGEYNVLAGYRAGYNLTTGNNNTIIGNIEGSAGLADTIIIGAGSAEKIKVDSSNNVFLTGTIKTISGGTTGVPIYTTSGDADTGISFPAANTIALSASGLGRVAVDINRVTVSGTFLATTISGTAFASTLGTTSAPSYSFSGDLNTGIFSPAADRVSITASGLGKLAVDINRTTVSGTFFADTVSGTVVTAALGSVTAPSFSFSGDLNTGLYSPSADVVAVTSSGQQVVRFQSDLSSTFAGAVNIGGILNAGVYVPTSSVIPSNGMYLPATDILGFATASTERLRIDTNGNIKVGGSVDRATTAGTKQVILYDGTAPAGTLASGVSLYSTLGVLNAMDATGSGVTLAPYIRTPIGSLSSMAIGPNGSNTTGFYYPNTTSVAIVASGLTKVSVDTNRTSVSGTFYADTVSGTTFSATLGTATAPTYSFSGDLNTGLYSPAADRVAVTASGLTKLAVDINRTTVSGTFYADTVSGMVVTAGLGTQSAPGFTFSGDINTGMFSPLPDVLAFTTAGVARMSVEESRVTVSGVLYSTTFSGLNILTGLGTAGAPAISPIGGTNTGIFYPDTSTVAVSTGGTERLRIGSTGVVAIGSTITNGGGSGSTLRWANDMTGAATVRAIYGTPIIQSGVTGNATLYETSPSTSASAFTVTSLFHYAASQGIIGASSAITNQYGFSANGSLIGATNNYGFFSNIPAASGRWNFYAAGTAANYFAGATQTALGSAAAPSLTPIGGTNTGIFYPNTSTVAVSTGGSERLRVTSSGRVGIGIDPESALHVYPGLSSVTAIGGRSINYGVNAQVASGRTGFLVKVENNFTVNGDNSGFMWLYPFDTGGDSNYKVFRLATGATLVDKFWVTQAGGGYFAGATQTALGSAAAPSLTPIGGTNTGIFYPSTSTVAISTSGVESMRIDNNQRVGIGGNPGGTTALRVTGNITGGTDSRAYDCNSIVQSDVTTVARVYYANPGTVDSAFTLTDLRYHDAQQGTFGASSTVTNQYGYYANGNLTGATNNYGFWSNLAAATGRWNFYAAGTAANYFAGNVGIGNATTPTAHLEVSSATGSASPTPTEIRISTTTSASDWSLTDPWGRLAFYSADPSEAGAKVQAAVDVVSASTNGGVGSLSFKTTTAGTGALIERMRIDTAGRIVTPLGTAAVPVYTPSGGTNTGIFYPDTSTVAVSTGGGEKLRLSSTGISCLGQTTARMMANGITPGLQVEGVTSVSFGSIGLVQNRTDALGSRLCFLKSKGAAYGSFTSVANDDELGAIYFDGTDGTSAVRGAYIQAFVDGTPGTNDMPGRLTFSTTADGSASPTERMRIDSSGRVGIGTSSPNILLHLSESNNSNTGIQITNTQNSIDGYMVVTGSGYSLAGVGPGTTFFASDGNVAVGSYNANQPLQFIAAGTERARFDNAGRLLQGIATARANFFNGSTSPSHQLESSSAIFSCVRNNNDTFGAGIVMGKSRSSGNTIVADGDVLGVLSYQGNDGSEFVEAGKIEVRIDGAPAANDMPGRMIFYTTADGASSPTERMRIDSSGRTLINTTSARGVGSSTTAHLIVETTNALLPLAVTRNANDAVGAVLSLGKSRAGSTGGTTIVADGDYVGELRFGAADGTDMECSLAYIRGFVSGTPASNDTPGRLTFGVTSTGTTPLERVSIYGTGNVKIGGTANRGTTEGTNQLVIFNGTAPVGTLTNGVSLYSATGELRVMDAAGNSTLLSPHDHETNEWVYDSTDTNTGKRLRINMEKMMKFLNDYFGLDFVQETFVDI